MANGIGAAVEPSETLERLGVTDEPRNGHLSTPPDVGVPVGTVRWNIGTPGVPGASDEPRNRPFTRAWLLWPMASVRRLSRRKRWSGWVQLMYRGMAIYPRRLMWASPVGTVRWNVGAIGVPGGASAKPLAPT